MRRFALYIFTVLSIYLILLVGTTWVFGLSSHTIPEASINNNKLAHLTMEGHWTKGGMREISSHYNINNQGFNSLRDYSDIDQDKVSVALIGDSFVEGYHVDVENSIGRLLEQETHDEIVVHEYGKAGGNIQDFSLVFMDYVKGRYDYTFILTNDEDIIMHEANFMGKGATIAEESLIRDIYDHLSYIRYLNIKYGLDSKLRDLFILSSNDAKKSHGIQDSDVNVSALGSFDNTCTILNENNMLDTQRLKSCVFFPCIEIVHRFTPSSYGFNDHWNVNGRRSCALTMKNYLDRLQKL